MGRPTSASFGLETAKNLWSSPKDLSYMKEVRSKLSIRRYLKNRPVNRFWYKLGQLALGGTDLNIWIKARWPNATLCVWVHQAAIPLNSARIPRTSTNVNYTGKNAKSKTKKWLKIKNRLAVEFQNSKGHLKILWDLFAKTISWHHEFSQLIHYYL